MTNERRILNQTLNSLIQKQQNQIVFFLAVFCYIFAYLPPSPLPVYNLYPPPQVKFTGGKLGSVELGRGYGGQAGRGNEGGSKQRRGFRRGGAYIY